VHRTTGRTGRHLKLLVYIAAASVTGSAAGGTLAWIGSSLTAEARFALTSGLAVLATGVGFLELVGRPVPLVERDQETPYRWVKGGPLSWAARNGAALGIGMTSRIGFPLWYVVPLGSFVSGSLAVGGATYGLYALARSTGAAGVLFATRKGSADRTTFQLIRRGALARRVAAAQLTMVGAVTCIFVGV